ALAVVLGGYAGLVVAARRTERPVRAAAGAEAEPPVAAAVTGAFLLLAVLQNQDVLWANAQLAGPQAARFAVVSTLGGIAAFATTTVPLVLLPRARRREPGALTAAIGTAVVLGAGAVLTVLIAGPALIDAVFGARYGAVAPLAVPYLGAMALLGVSRVIVAHRCAVASTRPVLIVLAAAAALQAVLIISLGRDATSVAEATLAASALLTAGLSVIAGYPYLSRRRRVQIGTEIADARALELVPRPRTFPDVPAIPAPRPRPVRPGIAPVSRVAARLAGLSLAGRLVAGLTVGGFIIRLLAGRSLWLDEATSINQAHMSFAGMWNSLRSTDVQPPLHDTLLWVINHLAGDSELAMRAPSLLGGTLLIPVVYLIGRDLWDRRTGVLAATLTTLAPFVIWYSQEARMYAVFMLLASLALWAQVRILARAEVAGERRWGWWALYSLSTVGLAWTQYFGALYTIVQQAAFAIAILARPGRRRELLVPWLSSIAVMVVLIAPLLPFVAHQFQVNQSAGRGFGATPSQNGSDLEAGHRTPTVYAVLTNLVWGVWGYHSASTMSALTALWPLGMLLALTLLGRGRSWRAALLLGLASFPIAVLFVVGQFKPFLFEIRYFCCGVPVGMLLIGRLCSSWSGRRRLGAIALTAGFALSFLVAFADQQLSQTNPRLYDFQGSLARISAHAKPGDELLYAPPFLNDLVGYYAPRIHSEPLRADPAHIAPHGDVFIMASFQEQPQNAQFVRHAISDMLRSGRAEIRYFTRPQVQVWEFR
ncbi:MAG TPA: glycosyltransferase family 39 protein, partial [Solirubrobacteraceae bacterium]